MIKLKAKIRKDDSFDIKTTMKKTCTLEAALTIYSLMEDVVENDNTFKDIKDVIKLIKEIDKDRKEKTNE